MKRNANLKISCDLHAIVTFEKQSIILVVAIIVMRTGWQHCRENQNTWLSQLIKMYLEDKQIDLLYYLATLSWFEMKCAKYARKTLMLPINFCCHKLWSSPILVLTIYLAASRIVKISEQDHLGSFDKIFKEDFSLIKDSIRTIILLDYLATH